MDKKSVKSLLWEIKGNGLPFTSYIFGTIHLLGAKDLIINDKVNNAISKCTQMIMEMDLSNTHEMDEMHELSKSSHSIVEELTNEERAELKEILYQQFNLKLDDVLHLPPITFINMMVNKAVECTDPIVFEQELLPLATRYGLATGGLETARKQMEIANELFTGKEILRQLKETDSYKDLYSKMVEAYLQEDLPELNNLVNDKRFMTDLSNEILVIRRNNDWVKKMPGIMKKATFFAVGAGHLGGAHGVLNLLEIEGYSVLPLFA